MLILGSVGHCGSLSWKLEIQNFNPKSKKQKFCSLTSKQEEGSYQECDFVPELLQALRCSLQHVTLTGYHLSISYRLNLLVVFLFIHTRLCKVLS